MVTIRETNLAFTRPLVPRKTTSRIVLHHTASGDVSAHTIHDWHLPRKGFFGCGYHYVVRADGGIERGRPEHMRGVHASRANADSIAIAIPGNFEKTLPTSAQMASLVRLIRDIGQRYKDLPVVGHGDVGATACPGRLFPWAELRRRLQRLTHTVVSGDTLFSLARRYNVTVAQLRQWNSLPPDGTLLRRGQRLFVQAL